MFCFLHISSPKHSTSLDPPHTLILSNHQPLGQPRFCLLQISSPKHSTRLDPLPTLILSSHQPLGLPSVLFPSDFSLKPFAHLNPIPTLVLTSHQPLGLPSVLFRSDFFTKTLYTPRPFPYFNIILPSKPGSPKCSVSFRFLHQNPTRLDPIPTLILSSHQTLGFSTVFFPSDSFIKTLKTPRQNTHFNIILPSNLGSPKCSVSFIFLHQTPVQVLTNFPTLILSFHQSLVPLSVLFPSDFFTKTLYTSRPNPHFNIILPSTPGSPKCSLYFRFLHQNTLHT